MPDPIAKEPFHFIGCHDLPEMVGRRAWNEQELMEGIEEAPVESLYYHIYTYFLRHPNLLDPFPNDFANWTATKVRDTALAECLAALDPGDYPDLEALRRDIVEGIEDHLQRLAFIPRTLLAEPFYFMSSTLIVEPTGLVARSLGEFREILSRVDAGVLYYHTFEAMRCRARPHGEFATWAEESLRFPALARALESIRPSLLTLEELRGEVMRVCLLALEGRL